MKVADYVWVISGPVKRLADVVAKMVQFEPSVFKKLDEFPFAVADRRTRRAALIAVMRVMPEQRAAVEVRCRSRINRASRDHRSG